MVRKGSSVRVRQRALFPGVLHQAEESVGKGVALNFMCWLRRRRGLVTPAALYPTTSR